ncbi:nuclear transport factor 2 family protein [Leisingera aquimarina]|uniref:nuclear transport factor 2 family protein n=1 Tax=Leisingera aquimarina TaxID=476529 RepID=UPI0003FF4430|nr:nuclear transport factor 2 family protein [Leisingera aquimarina]
MASKKNLLKTLLKGLETGDPAAAAVVNEAKYIQHNPQTHEGSEGLAELFARLARTSPKVAFKRVFEDGDFVFAHVEYDFSSLRAAFEVFRFEDGRAVEHWDNIQPLRGPNPSGRGMQDGTTEITGLNQTESTRALARNFTEQVLIKRQLDLLPQYAAADLIQHSPDLPDGLPALRDALQAVENGKPCIRYQHLHRVLAEGNFVLCASEGRLNGAHTSFYDLYRIESGRIAEHWDTVETIPPRSEWKNDNGKF